MIRNLLRLVLNVAEWDIACEFLRVASLLLYLSYDDGNSAKIPSLKSLVVLENLDGQDFVGGMMRVTQHLTETILVMVFRKFIQSLDFLKKGSVEGEKICRFVNVFFPV